MIFSILPGDSTIMTMGQRADVSSEEAVRKELGLDKGLIIASFLRRAYVAWQ